MKQVLSERRGKKLSRGNFRQTKLLGVLLTKLERTCITLLTSLYEQYTLIDSCKIVLSVGEGQNSNHACTKLTYAECAEIWLTK